MNLATAEIERLYRAHGHLVLRRARALLGSEADALAEVRAVLGLRPDEVAAAVVYYHLDGMTYDEIAGQLGCSRRKVGYLLERAQDVLTQERERAEQTG